MNIGITVAMEEELEALKSFCISNSISLEKVNNNYNLSIYKFNYKKTQAFVIVSNIGKVAAACATVLLINSYKCGMIINIGTCGGLNGAGIGDIILSNKAGYSDVDVTVFGYKFGQLPMQPELFISSSNLYNFDKLFSEVSALNNNINTGTVITNDSFITNKELVNKIKNIYNNIKAVEMEGAAIAQTCYLLGADFLLIKKISDFADDNATHSFSEEIGNIAQDLPKVITTIFNNLQNNNTN